jgi:hypothetical protein
MISTAVIVGEITATDWASSCGKPSALVRSGGPADLALGSVVIVIVVDRLSRRLVGDTTGQNTGHNSATYDCDQDDGGGSRDDH